MESLYSHPDAYNLTFPVGMEEMELFGGVVGGPRSAVGGAPTTNDQLPTTLLDLGSGSSPFASQLEAALLRRPPTTDRRPPFRIIAFDPDPIALLSNPARSRVAGDAWAMPFGDAAFGGIVSRLFGVAYALGAAWEEPGRWAGLAGEVGRVLAPAGTAMLEVPLAWRPERLQGVEESVGGRRSAVGGEVQLPDDATSTDRCSLTADRRPSTADLHYSFRYLDLLATTPWGAILDSIIEVELPSPTTNSQRPTTAVLHAPLHVFTPDGARRWAASGGMEVLGFFASYDRDSLTQEPPPDCLRGVVWMRRGVITSSVRGGST